MYVVIVGGGKIGAHLAGLLLGQGHQVVVIEQSQSNSDRICERLAGKSGLMVVSGDGCDPKILAETGIDRAHVVVAITGDDEDNLVICQIARKIFGVKRVVARVNDPRNEETFHELGIEAAISSTTIIGHLVEEEAVVGHLERLTTLSKGRLDLIELTLDDTAAAVGRRIADLSLPKDSIIVALLRKEDVLVPDGATLLADGDTVLAVVNRDKAAGFREILAGPARG